MSHKIGFIGSGNMGGALIVAACKSTKPENVIITDYDIDKANELASKCGCAVAQSNEELVSDADYIVLAVKPNVIRGVVKNISPALNQRANKGNIPVIVTIAAGINIATIKSCLDVDIPVIRIMPNTPAMVGEGMILITRNSENPTDVSDEQLSQFQELLASAGLFEAIPESAMDYTTAISGCTPAYAYMFIEALADGAVQVGVPRKQAIKLAAQAVLGSAAMVLETGIHPDELKDNVCSPGGSTIVGVTTLEHYGFRNAASQAIIKATEKNIDLGK